MTKKTFKLDASQIKPLVPGVGGCLATDAVTVEGLPVGFMYRMPPTEEADTGWTFLSGTESDEYLADQAHFDVYDVNSIANCDVAIIPFLHHPPGSAFARQPDGAFAQVDGPPVPDEHRTPKEFPFVQGRYGLTADWSLELPVPFKRRIDDGSLVLWRPGITLWLNAYGLDGETIEERVELLRKDASPNARDWISETPGGIQRFAYRLDESKKGAPPSFYGFVVADSGHLSLSIYFDDEASAVTAKALWESVCPCSAEEA